MSVDVVSSNSSTLESRKASRVRLAQTAKPFEPEPFELVTLAPRSAVVMRLRSTAADLPRGFFHRYELIARHLREHGLEPASDPFAIYDNVDGNAADVVAGFVVDGEARSGDGILVEHMPGVTMATLLHRGAYSNIEASYYRLLECIHARGLTRSGRFMETYLSNPFETADEDLRTMLMVPVGPLSANDR